MQAFLGTKNIACYPANIVAESDSLTYAVTHDFHNISQPKYAATDTRFPLLNRHALLDPGLHASFAPRSQSIDQAIKTSYAGK